MTEVHTEAEHAAVNEKVTGCRLVKLVCIGGYISTKGMIESLLQLSSAATCL